MEKILSWVFRKVSPWYTKRIIEEVSKLPHDPKCGSVRGPYICNCAKHNLEQLLGHLSNTVKELK